jgi:hypothetical protein
LVLPACRPQPIDIEESNSVHLQKDADVSLSLGRQILGQMIQWAVPSRNVEVGQGKNQEMFQIDLYDAIRQVEAMELD